MAEAVLTSIANRRVDNKTSDWTLEYDGHKYKFTEPLLKQRVLHTLQTRGIHPIYENPRLAGDGGWRVVLVTSAALTEAAIVEVVGRIDTFRTHNVDDRSYMVLTAKDGDKYRMYVTNVVVPNAIDRAMLLGDDIIRRLRFETECPDSMPFPGCRIPGRTIYCEALYTVRMTPSLGTKCISHHEGNSVPNEKQYWLWASIHPRSETCPKSTELWRLLMLQRDYDKEHDVLLDISRYSVTSDFALPDVGSHSPCNDVAGPSSAYVRRSPLGKRVFTPRSTLSATRSDVTAPFTPLYIGSEDEDEYEPLRNGEGSVVSEAHDSGVSISNNKGKQANTKTRKRQSDLPPIEVIDARLATFIGSQMHVFHPAISNTPYMRLEFAKFAKQYALEADTLYLYDMWWQGNDNVHGWGAAERKALQATYDDAQPSFLTFNVANKWKACLPKVISLVHYNWVKKKLATSAKTGARAVARHADTIAGLIIMLGPIRAFFVGNDAREPCYVAYFEGDRCFRALDKKSMSTVVQEALRRVVPVMYNIALDLIAYRASPYVKYELVEVISELGHLKTLDAWPFFQGSMHAPPPMYLMKQLYTVSASIEQNYQYMHFEGYIYLFDIGCFVKDDMDIFTPNHTNKCNPLREFSAAELEHYQRFMRYVSRHVKYMCP